MTGHLIILWVKYSLVDIPRAGANLKLDLTDNLRRRKVSIYGWDPDKDNCVGVTPPRTPKDNK